VYYYMTFMILFTEHLLMTKNNIKKNSVLGVKIFFKYSPPPLFAGIRTTSGLHT